MSTLDHHPTNKTLSMSTKCYFQKKLTLLFKYFKSFRSFQKMDILYSNLRPEKQNVSKVFSNTVHQDHQSGKTETNGCMQTQAITNWL